MFKIQLMLNNKKVNNQIQLKNVKTSKPAMLFQRIKFHRNQVDKLTTQFSLFIHFQLHQLNLIKVLQDCLMSKMQKKGPAFLLKTYDMLEKEEFREIIDWIPDGTGLVVKNPTELAQKVLPKYFKHSNMHSFIRQLNMYGFNKKRGSKTQNYYFHKLFHKGQRDMINQMQRKAEKKGTHKDLAKQSEQQEEEVSIEVEEEEIPSHDNNKQNKNFLLSQNLANEQNRIRVSSEVEQNQMKKNLVEMTALNKALLMEQIYHLANIEAGNVLSYHQKMEEDEQKSVKKEQRKNLLQRFKRVKNQYLQIHSLIWDKASAHVQVYENDLIKIAEAQSKDHQKPTEVQIVKKSEQQKDEHENNKSEKKESSQQKMHDQEIKCERSH